MTYPGSLRYKDEKLTKKESDKIRKANKAKGWPKTTIINISPAQIAYAQCLATAVLFNRALDMYAWSKGKRPKVTIKTYGRKPTMS